MRKVIAICMSILALAAIANAQVSVGVSPIYSTQITQNLFLNSVFENKNISCEVEVGLVSICAIRGYHLCNREYNTTVNIFDEKEKKSLPATFTYGFSASRIEIGYPFRLSGALLEPFFVDSYTRNYNTVVGDKINYMDNLTSNTRGLGVYYSQLLYKGNNASIKGFYTPKDYILDFRYNRFNNRAALGLGYSYRVYDNIKISGPSINFLLTF